jgi:hypothetical protein
MLAPVADLPGIRADPRSEIRDRFFSSIATFMKMMR